MHIEAAEAKAPTAELKQVEAATVKLDRRAAEIKKQLGRRLAFIFILDADTHAYLNWAAKERKTHKAEIVRAAVKAVMLKDTDFTQMLKTIDGKDDKGA